MLTPIMLFLRISDRETYSCVIIASSKFSGTYTDICCQEYRYIPQLSRYLESVKLRFLYPLVFGAKYRRLTPEMVRNSSLFLADSYVNNAK